MAAQTGCLVLVVSLLDDAGTLAAWGWTSKWPAPAVRLMEHQPLLAPVAASWAELIAKLHDPALVAGGAGSREEWRGLMRVLYEVLWAPLTDMVEGCERVLIAPQGELLLVPWAALVDPQVASACASDEEEAA